MTLLLSLIGIVGGAIIGVLGAAVQTYPGRWAVAAKIVLVLYVQFVRRVPLLILLLLSHVGLFAVGIRPSNLTIASVAIVLYAGAYLIEIIRSGVEALPTGQWDAGVSIGLTHTQVLLHVILPQSFRMSLAASASFIQSLIKDTSMAVIVGLVELTQAGLVLRYRFPLESFWIFAALLILYFLICYPISVLSDRLEKKVKSVEVA